MSPTPPEVGKHRWVICGLLFFAATVNYIDRQVIGILKSTLETDLGWKDERIYASIVFTFQLAYTIAFLAAGKIMDWLGVRKGFSLFVVVWSIAAVGHGAADWFPWMKIPSLNLDKTGFAFTTLTASAAGFALMRFILGLGEAGNFPASIKAVADWFPKKERALATGIFNSGTNIAALVTPIAVPWITAAWGWQWAFVLTGLTGFIWLGWWLTEYRTPEEHPKLGPTELAYIRSDPVEQVTAIPWKNVLPLRQTWAFAVGKLLTDPFWWMYLFWIPGFLHDTYKLDLKASAGPLVVIYGLASVGSIGGGWLSSRLLARGITPNRARKTALLVCALCVVPIMFAAKASNVWVATILVALAAAAHQGWSANLFTLTSDMFPRQAVGSVVGIGGMMGGLGGMLIALVVGAILEATHKNYAIVFMMPACAYLVALALIHLLAPRLEQAKLSQS
jgi:ACS family hexuronate transporter-like MFS transporter